MTSSDLLVTKEGVRDALQLGDPKQHRYFTNYLSEACLAKFVELLFCNQSGRPLRLLPFQRVMLHLLWHKKFPMVLACRGGGKTFMIAVYALLKCLLDPNSRIVIVSGGFRQAKFTFGYMDTLLRNSPILSDTIRKYHPGNDFGVKYATDKVYLKVGPNTDVTGIPIGDGTKVRGMRATILICDEVASIDDKVFDTAIGPFLSVGANPDEAVMMNDFIERLKGMGCNQKVMEYIDRSWENKGNQLILMGTATYQFSHFYRRYQAYSIFAKSGGDPRKIKEGLQVQAGEVKIEITNDNLDLWRDMYRQYSIFQLPYEQMPKGFLDSLVVATHKAMMDPVIFGHEYQCRFSKDTHGFFPRSIVEAASPGLKQANAGEEEVHYELYGDAHSQYVMGLDPARHNDNFGLVVLKLENGTAKCVYVDAWDKTEWSKSVKKIREVLHRFPNIVYIACDSGGGGSTVRDLLANAQMLKGDEKPILEFDPPDEFKAIPNALRIMEMVNFHTWSSLANHAMRSDIILKKLLFPGRLDDDAVLLKHGLILKGEPFDLDDPKDVITIEHLHDILYGTETDDGEIITLGTYRDMMALVDELCTIIQTVTEKGTETFGLPRLSDQAEGLDIRRRDRYSALLLAAYAARHIQGHGHERLSTTLGGSPDMILSNSTGRPKGGDRYRPMYRKGGVAY